MEPVRQEAPVCPESIQKAIKAFDPRLRVVFNTRHRVWQVEEYLTRQGVWSHVLYWCDLAGDYTQKVFRPLPESADPLIVEIQRRDVERAEHGGGSVLRLAKKLDANGATERARKALELSKERRRKFSEFDRVMRRHAPILVARHNMGGYSAQRAMAERLAIRRDLLIGEG